MTIKSINQSTFIWHISGNQRAYDRGHLNGDAMRRSHLLDIPGTEKSVLTGARKGGKPMVWVAMVMC